MSELKVELLKRAKEIWLGNGPDYHSNFVCDCIDRAYYELWDMSEPDEDGAREAARELTREISGIIEGEFSVYYYLLKKARREVGTYGRLKTEWFKDLPNLESHTTFAENEHPIIKAFRLGLLDGLITKYEEQS